MALKDMTTESELRLLPIRSLVAQRANTSCYRTISLGYDAVLLAAGRFSIPKDIQTEAFKNYC